jgi:C4-dicarboxylate transporter, DctQ subunit
MFRLWGFLLARKWEALLTSLGHLVALLTAVMTLAVVYEVVARYFFGRPTIWATDLTEYTLLYVTFLGAAWVLRDGSHIQVELLIDRLGPRPRLALSTIISLVAGGVVAVLMWKGAEVTWEAYVKGQAMLNPWRVSRWLLMLPIALGSLLLTIEFLRQAWASFHAWRHGEQPVAPRAIDV